MTWSDGDRASVTPDRVSNDLYGRCFTLLSGSDAFDPACAQIGIAASRPGGVAWMAELQANFTRRLS